MRVQERRVRNSAVSGTTLPALCAPVTPRRLRLRNDAVSVVPVEWRRYGICGFDHGVNRLALLRPGGIGRGIGIHRDGAEALRVHAFPVGVLRAVEENASDAAAHRPAVPRPTRPSPATHRPPLSQLPQRSTCFQSVIFLRTNHHPFLALGLGCRCRCGGRGGGRLRGFGRGCGRFFRRVKFWGGRWWARL